MYKRLLAASYNIKMKSLEKELLIPIHKKMKASSLFRDLSKMSYNFVLEQPNRYSIEEMIGKNPIRDDYLKAFLDYYCSEIERAYRYFDYTRDFSREIAEKTEKLKKIIKSKRFLDLVDKFNQ